MYACMLPRFHTNKNHTHARAYAQKYADGHTQTQDKERNRKTEKKAKERARLIMFIGNVHRRIHVLYVHICMDASSTAFICVRSVMSTYVDILCMYNVAYVHEYTNTVTCTPLAFIRTSGFTCPSTWGCKQR